MQTRNLIDGEWQDAPSGATFEITNPATDEVPAADFHEKPDWFFLKPYI